MEIALPITVVLGLVSFLTILLSLEIDRLKKRSQLEIKSQEERIYRLSVLSEIQRKIAYTTDVEKVTDIIISALRNFFDYSIVTSAVIKNDNLILKTYIEEQVDSKYIENIEKSILSSLSQLIGRIPEKIDRRFYGVNLNDTIKSAYSSSFHIPLIVKNSVLGLIHISSTKQNLYKDRDMETLYQLIEIASSSLMHLNETLDAENGRSSLLIKSIGDGIMVTDNKNNLLVINDAAKRILSINKGFVNFSDIASVFSQNLDLGSKINEVIVGNKPVSFRAIELNDKIIDLFINPVSNERVSIVMHDMTEYQKEQNLKQELMHIMVHELRSPITTIKDSAELIISTPNFEESEKLKFLETINEQAKKILGRIGSILDIGKFDAGKLTLQKTKGDIVSLIKTEIESFMPQAEKKNISLTFDALSHPLPLIYFDSPRIAQVIDNLLSNSLKFTQENGKIKIGVDYKVIPPTLEGSSPMGDFSSLDKYIVAAVSDTGVGIAQEQQRLLFSKYSQGEDAPPEIAKLGTGLGLYMVKGIVESHGGHVWVKSVVGQGTTISFSLPARNDTQRDFYAPKIESTPSPLSKLAKDNKLNF